MKNFLKNIGLIVILIGVIVVGINSFNPTTSNTPLAIGGILIVLGLILQVVMGRYIE